ncbi:unnamed protein product [Phytophthora fragariaefolia]|uniref:Unnamed protein product n=1 Tax=Phytophthora fragariaefolia TaxID=1490495 RepID=A0A9W7CXH4_9STRA|nr:unnamed protein product [Phytophthora fragariaefolia]
MSSKKLLRTIASRERPSTATPQNSARSTPAHTTPAHTPARAASARPTPPRAAPARASPANIVTAQARTTGCDSRTGCTPPNRNDQCHLPSTPLARVLFSDQQELAAHAPCGVGPRDLNTSSHPFDSPSTDSRTTENPRPTPTSDHAGDNLTAELDTVVLSDRQLDEYLEHFDWGEIGEYGDEETIGLWSNILETPRTSSSSCCSASSSNADGDGTSPEAGTSVGRGTSDCDADQHGGNPSGGGATDSANSSTGNGAPFATTRLGSHADPIPPANRRPYPPDNDPCFPQAKRYTGIRERKASLASLVTHV